MEWDDLRYFLAAARHGSFSGAARAPRTAQPTMGRRVDAFEARMGARLFERPTGLKLTGAGIAILSLAESMEEIALAAERTIFGSDAGLAGAVRISAPEWYALRILSPLAARQRLRRRAAGYHRGDSARSASRQSSVIRYHGCEA